MHEDSGAFIKVVHFGITLLSLPNMHAVELVEKQIGKQKKLHEIEEPDMTFFDL